MSSKTGGYSVVWTVNDTTMETAMPEHRKKKKKERRNYRKLQHQEVDVSLHLIIILQQHLQ